jgi:hypothetical protein
VNERTNEVRRLESNDDGNFSFTGLEPSDYLLGVKYSGFSDVELTAIPLQVGQEIRRNIQLAVSTTNATVTVEGGAISAVDQSDAKLGVNVSEREVSNLPLNGRQVSQLYLLTPGAVNSGSGTYDNIRFSGRSNQQNIVRYDGVEASSNGLAYVNPAAFSVPAPGTFGNSGRNLLSGPALAQLDLTLSKKFSVTERVNIELRSEAYNITNHANFANPGNLRLNTGLPTAPGAAGIQPRVPFSAAAAGGTFGVLNSTVSNQIGLGTARQLQLALRLNF